MAMQSQPFPEAWINSWNWEGLQVSLLKAPPISATHEESSSSQEPLSSHAAPLVLIHGFGACKEHWRHNVDALREDRYVYALDLVGFGESAKPRSVLSGEPKSESSLQYGIDLWANQVASFVSEWIGSPAVLIGNSIGGVVALEAARRLEEGQHPPARVILIDCAQRALDDKFLAEQPPLRRWGRPLLKSLVRQRWLTTGLFRSLIKPNIIRSILRQAYPSGKNIDDQLVDILLRPALKPGAEEAFRGFINLFNDKTAPEILEKINTPVSLIWGANDPWEPIAKAQDWKQFACVEAMYELPGLGHCPHDEDPEQVNRIIASIITTTK